MKFLLLLITVLGIFSCKSNTSSKANDHFKKEVLSTITFKGDTLQQMESLLAKLDSHNVSYEKFIAHSCYELSDSISEVVENKFPKGMENGNEEATNYHYELLSKAISDYGLQYGVNNELNDFSTVMFVIYEPIKSYCNDYRNQLIKEPEEIKDSFK